MKGLFKDKNHSKYISAVCVTLIINHLLKIYKGNITSDEYSRMLRSFTEFYRWLGLEVSLPNLSLDESGEVASLGQRERLLELANSMGMLDTDYKLVGMLVKSLYTVIWLEGKSWENDGYLEVIVEIAKAVTDFVQADMNSHNNDDFLDRVGALAMTLLLCESDVVNSMENMLSVINNDARVQNSEIEYMDISDINDTLRRSCERWNRLPVQWIIDIDESKCLPNRVKKVTFHLDELEEGKLKWEVN